jgi:hypothetical protein
MKFINLKEKKKLNRAKKPLTFGDHEVEWNCKQKNVYAL